MSAAGQFPAAKVAAFLCEGLRAGEAALTLATAPHAAEVLAACREQGIDSEAEGGRGALVTLPAESSLAGLLKAGRPDLARFEDTIGHVVEGLSAGGRRVRAYGEMVDLLWSRGDRDDALALEELWNGLLARVPLRLLCGYTLEAFEGDGDVAAFRRMCARHESVSPVGASEAEALDSERLQAELEVQSTHVRAENRGRRRAEEAERAARELLKATNEQLARLQTVTSALAEAVTLDDVGRLADSEIMRAVGATYVVLAVAEGEQRLRLLAHSGAAPDPLNYAHLAVDERSPVPEAHRTGLPVWIGSPDELERRYPGFAPPGTSALGSLPIRVAGRRLGVLAFGFAAERRFSTMERAFMQDLARQVGFALERGRLYEEARRSEARLREANQRKDEFLALLGHELRNPLAPIMTALQVMKLRGDTSSERERAMIERQVRHVRRLVDDLLDVSRITQGKLELQKAPVDVNNVIAQAIEWAGPLIEQRFHRLKVDMPRDSLWIEADAGRLAQAVGNLLTNAAKYTDRGGTITMRVRRESGHIVIAVRDTGAGIAPEMLSRVFERFVQVDRTVERSQGGLGLGLALVKSLVALHGGAVSCTSDGPGLGSEFRISLPAITVAPLVPERSPARHARRAPASVRRVLIVDDNPDAADALADMLEALGHETQVAYDGVEAIEKARGREFDVAILDLNLPVMDGYEVARGMRELGGGRAMRFIAVTGFGTEDDHARSKAAGFADHLVKPIDYDRLLSVLEAPRS